MFDSDGISDMYICPHCMNVTGAVQRMPYHSEVRIGRNDPCPCGSGKKYKRCCGKI